MPPKTKLTICFLAVIIGIILLTGCEATNLRFSPSESQKKIAYNAAVTAKKIEAEGTAPGSPAAKQNVEATKAALDYIGLPANPEIIDYPTILYEAQTDASIRPTQEDVFEAVDQGLSLASELAILFGVGGASIGGLKLKQWIQKAREKSKALHEIIINNDEFLKDSTEDIKKAFKKAQKAQSPETKILVTETKS